MNRRHILSAIVSLGCVVPALAGCDCLHNLRHQDSSSGDPNVKQTSAESSESDSTKILDVQSDPAKSKKFFQSSRLPSGLSSESRDIERDLGIQ